MTYAKTLIAGTALLMSAQAFAGDYNNEGTNVLNGQMNFNTVWATSNLDVDHVKKDVGVSAQGVGNQTQIFTMNNTHVSNEQVNMGSIGADVNATIGSVGGNVSLGASVLCNGASVSTDPAVTAVRSSQTCGAPDPSATVNADIGYASGTVGVSAAAISNQLEVDSNATYFPTTSFQNNSSDTIATANVNVGRVAAVGVSTVAVGNTSQIIHY